MRDTAKRQYDAVEPENRLVARELERHWEQALLAQRKAQEEYERFQLSHRKDLSAADRQRILSLSTDIPALWKSSSTSAADRHEIIRQLVEKVVVHAQGKTEVVDVTIQWIGGYKPDEWWLEELALELKIPTQTLRGWCRKGWVHVRKVTLAHRRFIIWADAKELDRRRRLHRYRRGTPGVPYPSELTTPKPRSDR